MGEAVWAAVAHRVVCVRKGRRGNDPEGGAGVVLQASARGPEGVALAPSVASIVGSGASFLSRDHRNDWGVKGIAPWS